VIGLADEWVQYGTDDLAVIHGTKRLPHIMKQRHDHIFLVPTIPQGTSGSLEGML